MNSLTWIAYMFGLRIPYSIYAPFQLLGWNLKRKHLTKVSTGNNPQGQRQFPLHKERGQGRIATDSARRTHMHINLISWMLQISFGSGKLGVNNECGVGSTMKRRRRGAVHAVRTHSHRNSQFRPHTKRPLPAKESRAEQKICVTSKNEWFNLLDLRFHFRVEAPPSFMTAAHLNKLWDVRRGAAPRHVNAGKTFLWAFRERGDGEAIRKYLASGMVPWLPTLTPKLNHMWAWRTTRLSILWSELQGQKYPKGTDFTVISLIRE